MAAPQRQWTNALLEQSVVPDVSVNHHPRALLERVVDLQAV